MTTLLSLLQAHADGQVVEVIPSLGDPAVCELPEHVARAWLDAGVGVRIRPTLKPVDLSVLIDSRIDCEFAVDDSTSLRFGNLQHIDNTVGEKYKLTGVGFFNMCRPRLDHWHSWQGGECPLPEGLVVELQRRTSPGGRTEGSYGLTGWVHNAGNTDSLDIIAFRITGLADGYCWPWELTHD